MTKSSLKSPDAYARFVLCAGDVVCLNVSADKCVTSIALSLGEIRVIANAIRFGLTLRIDREDWGIEVAPDHIGIGCRDCDRVRWVPWQDLAAARAFARKWTKKVT